jgi:hypothetical protein
MANELINPGLEEKARAAAQRYKTRDEQDQKQKSNRGLSLPNSLPTGTGSSDSTGGTSNSSALADPSAYKRGGKVKKSGRARVHKGERVLTKKQDQKYRKVMRGKRSSGKR